MPIRYLSWITRDMVRAEPEARFVFGDNNLRVGMGGQAGAMRGEPNAIGVVTKRSPDMLPVSFFSDDSRTDRMCLERDLEKVAQALREGRTVYFPTDGIGTGLSQLPTRAPKLHNLIVDFLEACAGDPCPIAKVPLRAA